MDSEMYAKELTSEQYDRIMTPVKDSVLRGAQASYYFSQCIKQLIKEKKMKSDRYLLVNGIIHKIILPCNLHCANQGTSHPTAW